MDRAKAKRLLKKKSWTGKEVGQAYLYTLAEQTRALKEKKPFKQPFTREELTLLEESITVADQYTIFRAYANIYEALIDSSNLAEANGQQTYSGFYRYLYTLKDCMQADKALEAIEKHPLIMTRGQYERIKEDVIKERKSFTISLYEIITDYIARAVQAPEEAPAAIREAIEETKKQPCTNTRILSNYNEAMGEGYYTLPDGTRSDKLTSEEWQQKLLDNFLSTHKLTINGEEASPEKTVRHFNQQRLLYMEKLFFEGTEGLEKACKEKGIDWEAQGFTLEELLEMLESEIEFSGSVKLNREAEAAFNIITETTKSGTVWHTLEELPELTKYEVLEESELLLYYTGGFRDDVDIDQQQKEFIEDYPALYNAAVKEVKKLLPMASTIKEKDYLKELFTYGQLQEEGLTCYDSFLTFDNGSSLEYRELLGYYCKEDTTENMQKRLRIAYSGIAIIEEGSISPSQIAENGDYLEDQSNPYYLLESIDSITDDEDRQEDIMLYVEHLIKPALKYIYAYNALVDIIAAVYDTDCITIMKKNMDLIESQIEGFNGMLYTFYANVFGTKEEKARKRELIKQVFSPIMVDELQPDKKKLQAVKKKITDTYKKKAAIPLLKELDPLIRKIISQGKGA